jgi:hypothetical protein
VGSCNFVNDISLRDAEKFNETCDECKEMEKQNAKRAKEKDTAKHSGGLHSSGHSTSSKENVKGKEKVTAKQSGGLHSSGHSSGHPSGHSPGHSSSHSTPSTEKVTAQQSGGLHSSGHRR